MDQSLRVKEVEDLKLQRKVCATGSSIGHKTKGSKMSSKGSKGRSKMSSGEMSSKGSKSKGSRGSKSKGSKSSKSSKGSKGSKKSHDDSDNNVDEEPGDYEISAKNKALPVEAASLVDSSKRTEEDKAASDSGSFMLASKVQTWLLLGAVVLAALMCIPYGTFTRSSTREPSYAPLPVSSSGK